MLNSDEKYSRSKLIEECEDSTPMNNLKMMLTENYYDKSNISDIKEVLQDQESIIEELLQIGSHPNDETANFD